MADTVPPMSSDQFAAQMCHSPGTPFNAYGPRSSNSSSEPVTRSFTVLVTSTSPGPASALTPRADVHPDAGDVVGAPFDLTGVQPGADVDAERLHGLLHLARGTHAAARAVEKSRAGRHRCA